MDQQDNPDRRCAVILTSFRSCLSRQNDLDGNNPNGKNEAHSIEIDEKRYRPYDKHGGWKTMPFIFGNEICEKLAAIGFSANLIMYLTRILHMDNVKAATLLTNFGGTSSLTPLIGAFLADAYVGRFWMITASSIIYFLGTSLLTLSAITPSLQPAPCSSGGQTSSCPPASGSELAVVFLGLLLTAMGAGGIRPCVAAFGADQLNESPAEQQQHGGKKLWSFFNWYYFCMGVSALLAVTVIVYIQDNVGWALGFGIPTGLMLLSIVSFLVGRPLYVRVKPMGSPLTSLARVLVAAVRKRKLAASKSCPPPPLHELSDMELAAYAPSYQTRLLHTHQFRYLDRAAMRVEEDSREDGSLDPWRLCRVTEVEELKTILRMGPIWASGILLVTASAQQNTFSVLQARTMDRNVGGGTSSFQIPPGSMSVFSIASLVITVPLYDRIFMPVARKMTGHPRGITFLQRMGVGFVLSTLATSVAAVVEVKRKQAARSHGLLDSPSSTIPVSVFWLFPQYCLHGVAEAFMSIGHLEFFYDQSPESMRSTASALFWTSISFGSYLSSFLVTLIHRYTTGPNAWLPADNLNRGHLDYFFWLLTLLQVANFIFFCVSARWYKYKAVAQITAAVTQPEADVNIGNRSDDQFVKNEN